MIQEIYCSYEVSKLLKKKGFNESTQLVWYEHLPSPNAVYNSEIGKPKRDLFYWEKEGERNLPWTNNSPVPSYISGEVYSCPTHQMAMAYLREVHNFYICPKYCCFCGSKPNDRPYFKWEARILKLPSSNIIYPQPLDMCEHYETYEEAVEASLKFCLENLI